MKMFHRSRLRRARRGTSGEWKPPRCTARAGPRRRSPPAPAWPPPAPAHSRLASPKISANFTRRRFTPTTRPSDHLISNPVVYRCYEQANHRQSSYEHRSHRDALPQGQRPNGAKPLAHHLAARSGQDDQRDRSRQRVLPEGDARPAHRYNDEGPQGLGDRRPGNPGGTCLLSPEQQAQLRQALAEPPADGGLWTGPKVARWIASHTGSKVHAQRGWEYLKRLNYSKRVLRPRHTKADPAVQQAFKTPSRSR